MTSHSVELNISGYRVNHNIFKQDSIGFDSARGCGFTLHLFSITWFLKILQMISNFDRSYLHAYFSYHMVLYLDGSIKPMMCLITLTTFKQSRTLFTGYSGRQ